MAGSSRHAARARRLRHRRLVALADSLSLDIVAEGIEQPEQVGSLRDLNCRLGQGFHFSRPMAPAAAETFLRGVFDTKARQAA